MGFADFYHNASAGSGIAGRAAGQKTGTKEGVTPRSEMQNSILTGTSMHRQFDKDSLGPINIITGHGLGSQVEITGGNRGG